MDRQLKAILTTAVVAFVVGDQCGQWRMHSRFEKKMTEVLDDASAKAKISPDLTKAVKDWMYDPEDDRDIHQLTKDIVIDREINEILEEG